MNKWLLIIIIIAAVLRLGWLTKFPAGLNADEAALGYNAYSLLLTGRDEHGHAWPINLESFGDFKPVGYAYLLLPFVKILGLTETAVRLPSALMGIAAVFFIYLLTKETIDEKCAVIAAAVLALSPWHLHFSRGAWETNVATTLLILGSWSWVTWLKKHSTLRLVLAALCLAMSMYVYQSTRVIAPLLGLGWLVMYWPQVKQYKKGVGIALVVGGVLLLPLIWSIVTSDAGSRLTGVGLLADEGPVNRAKELRGQHTNWNTPTSRLFHNRLVLYSLAFVKNYSDHWGGNFLFINGDTIERNRVPESGLFYLTDALLLILGLVYLVKSSNGYTRLIWWWLLVAPVASAMTFQTPHAVRAFNMVVPLSMIIAMGWYYLWQIRGKYKYLAVLLAVISIWQVGRYLHQYYVHYPKVYPAAWEYGFKELVAYVTSVQDNYSQILVTDKYDQPYILFLFYSKYPPLQFQNNHTLSFRDKFNFSTVRDFDKYHFSSTPWEQVRDIQSGLIVAAPEDIPEEGVRVAKTIYFPNGQPAFKIISNQIVSN